MKLNHKIKLLYFSPSNVKIIVNYFVLLGRIELEDTLSFDNEDIAIGPSSIHDRDYIYLGDIGNNWHAKIHPFIYKFLEPKIDIDKNKYENQI